MARFYGTVQGGRGEATRLGHASTGLKVTAQSYSGDVGVFLSAQMGEDYVHIYVRPHKNWEGSKTIFFGPIAQLLDQSRRKTLLHALAVEELAE